MYAFSNFVYALSNFAYAFSNFVYALSNFVYAFSNILYAFSNFADALSNNAYTFSNFAGALKEASLHLASQFCHPFAGKPVRTIQALLDHNSSRTTEIYTHVTTKGFDKIRSPLDNLDI